MMDIEHQKWEIILGEKENIFKNSNIQHVSVKAAIAEKLWALAINHMLAIECDHNVTCNYFKSEINDVAILDGGYIAVADQAGALTLGVVDTTFCVKLSHNVISKKPVGQEKVFKKIEFHVVESMEGRKMSRLVCLCTTGKMLVFHNIILLDKDMDFSLVKMETVECVHQQAHDFVSNDVSIVTVGSGMECLALYSCNNAKVELNQTAELESVEELIKVHHVTTANVYFTLDSNGKLFIWHALTLCLLHAWSSQEILDFRILELETSVNFRLEDVKLVVQEEDKISCRNMLTESTLKEISAKAKSTLLCKGPPSSDDLYIATICQDTETMNATVYLRNHAETSPQKRLQYLLARKRYDEAEALAKQHGLHFTLDPASVQQRVGELKETFEETRLHIAKCKAWLLENKSKDEIVMEVLSEITSLDYRLEAYLRVYGEKQFSPEIWETFRDETPMTLFIEMLGAETEKAFIFWESFKDDLVEELKTGTIKQILDDIPDQVPYLRTAEWLCEWVVPFISTDPDAMTAVVEWVESKVFSLESENKQTWSSDAMDFCQLVVDKIESAVKCDIHQFERSMLEELKAKYTCGLCLSPLRALMKNLHWLRELSTEYNYQIGLEALRSETKETIVFRMLDRVMVVDILPLTLQDKVMPYIQSNGLVADQLFASYVQDLLEKSFGSSMHSMCSSILIEKIKFLVRLIGSHKEKVTAMLRFLDIATFPMPEFIRELTEEVISKCHHTLVTELEKKWKQKEFDNIIFTYGINHSLVKSKSDLEKVARFIIEKGGPFSLVEKLLSAKDMGEEVHLEMQQFKCKLMVDRNEFDAFRIHLKSLSPEVARKCCQYVLALARSSMPDKDHVLVEVPKIVRMQYYEAAEIASNFLLSLSDDPIEKSEVIKQSLAVKNVKALETQYNVLVNSKMLEDKIKSLEVLTDHAEKLKYDEIFKFARLLDVPECETLKLVLCRAAATSPLSSIRRFLILLSKKIPQTPLSVEFLQTVIRLLIDKSILGQSLCLQLSQLCLTHLLLDDFRSMQEMCCLASLIANIFEQSLAFHEKVTEEIDVYYKDNLANIDPDTMAANLLDVFELASENLLEKAWEKLDIVLEKLKITGQTQIAMQSLIMLMCLKNILLPGDSGDPALATQIAGKIKKFACILVGQMIEKRMLDPHLSLASLLVLSKQQAVSQLTSAVGVCGSNFGQMKRVAALASASAKVHNDFSLIEDSHKVQIAAKWGVRLSKIGIQFNYWQGGLLTVARESLKKLVQNPHCEPHILLEYFKDMELDSESYLWDESLVAMFEVCLLKHSPDSSPPEVLQKAKKILKCIKDNQLKILKNIYPKISSYNYEALEWIQGEILHLEANEGVSQGLELIRYLKYYTRCAPPTDMEMRYFRKDQDVEKLASALPEIAKVRLPFHLLLSSNCGKIITPEMNLVTLTHWLNIAPVVKLNVDTVIGNAVANVIAVYLQSKGDSSSAQISKEFLDVASQVETILSKVEDKKYPVCCCDSFLGRFRHAGELTLILKVALIYARQWLLSAQESGKQEEVRTAEKYVEMFTRKRKISSTQWALHKVGLHKDEDLTALVKQPKDLIQKLYEHPALLDKSDSRKDINAACDEIANAHGLSTQEIRESLLSKWLLGVSTSSGDLDQTITFGNVCISSNEQEDMERAVYILLSTDRTSCLKYMLDHLGIVGGQGEAGKRILFCLVKSGAANQTDLSQSFV